jgi:uncharacterized protein YndB with AHSA1/START domain
MPATDSAGEIKGAKKNRFDVGCRAPSPSLWAPRQTIGEGANFVVMRMPDGQEIPCPGVYLEIVPNERLVLTDAYSGGWIPKTGKPFMTVILTFAEENGQTRYTARVRHWSKEDYDTHVQMGFHQGWGQCTAQLAALAKTI